jgi:antitoxin ParD1/3/4
MKQDKIQLLKTKIQEGIDSGIATNFDPQKYLELLKAKMKK